MHKVHKARSGAARRRSRAHGGFSLIELMIGLTIIGIALAFGLPSLFQWLQSTQIRAGAESVLDGFHTAKTEAVRRNVNVQLNLTTLASQGSPAAPDWSVTCVTPTPTCPGTGMTEPEIKKFSAQEGAAATLVTAPQAAFVFNGMGRLVPVPNSTIDIDLTNPHGGDCAAAGGPMRCLRIQISTGGQVRLCDPALPSSNPRGC